MNEPTIPTVRLDWSGAVVVELRHAIRSDFGAGRLLQAGAGFHDGWCNPNGALSVDTPSGRLGVKPAECVRWRYVGTDVWFRWLRCAWAPERVAGREEGT